MTGGTSFWYASRATGLVALLLFTAVLVLGLLMTRRGRLPGLPGFALTSLHRNLSLLGVVFIVVHVLTAVFDGYVRIPLASAVVPFASAYERFWLGLGAVALDLIIALVATSLIRSRLSRRAWRGVHLLAYLCWPTAFVHGLGAGTDLRHGPLLDLTVGCALLVAVSVTWRLAAAARELPRAARVTAMFEQHAKRSHHTSRPGHPDRERVSR